MGSESNFDGIEGMDNKKERTCTCLLHKPQLVLKAMLEYRKVTWAIIVSHMALSIWALALGFLNLWTSCSLVKDISTFLMVKSCDGLFFWITAIVLNRAQSLSKSVTNAFFMGYVIVDNIFGLVWMCLGTYWVFDKDIEKLDCDGGFWNMSIYIQVYVILSVNWIFVAAFIFCYGYLAFNSEKQDNYTKRRSKSQTTEQ